MEEYALTPSPAKLKVASPDRRQPLGAFYDRMAPLYDLWVELFELKARHRAEELLGIQAEDTLLEVAIGPGKHFTRLARERELKMSVGLDLSSGMLRIAHSHLSRSKCSNAHLCRGDAITLPFREKTFDRILTCYMLDLLDESDIPLVLAECRRVLKPAGKLVIVNMADQSPLFNRLWLCIYHRYPRLVGGCRPIDAVSIMEHCGWRILHHEEMRQTGFRTELAAAKPI